jgi:hypothetical protein
MNDSIVLFTMGSRNGQIGSVGILQRLTPVLSADPAQAGKHTSKITNIVLGASII